MIAEMFKLRDIIDQLYEKSKFYEDRSESLQSEVLVKDAEVLDLKKEYGAMSQDLIEVLKLLNVSRKELENYIVSNTKIMTDIKRELTLRDSNINNELRKIKDSNETLKKDNLSLAEKVKQFELRVGDLKALVKELDNVNKSLESRIVDEREEYQNKLGEMNLSLVHLERAVQVANKKFNLTALSEDKAKKFNEEQIYKHMERVKELDRLNEVLTEENDVLKEKASASMANAEMDKNTEEHIEALQKKIEYLISTKEDIANQNVKLLKTVEQQTIKDEEFLLAKNQLVSETNTLKREVTLQRDELKYRGAFISEQEKHIAQLNGDSELLKEIVRDQELHVHRLKENQNDCNSQIEILLKQIVCLNVDISDIRNERAGHRRHCFFKEVVEFKSILSQHSRV
jgi:myosin heavy subunit